MIELVDIEREGHAVVVDVEHVAREIRSWYGPGVAVIEDERLIVEFADALAEQDDALARGLAAQLGVAFDDLGEDGERAQSSGARA